MDGRKMTALKPAAQVTPARDRGRGSRKPRASDHMAGLELDQTQTGPFHRPIDWAVEMTAAERPAPHGGQPVLPARPRALRARPMLDEQKAAARLQHAPDPNPTQFGHF